MSFSELLTKYGSTNTSYGTDKNTSHSYGPIYESLFKEYKYTCRNLLEIGFDSGISLQVYTEYFPNTTIYGIDIQDKCVPFVKNNPRITTFFGDATRPETINVFSKTYDIIVEDASHLPEHQIQHFKDYSPYVNKGGVYIIEDVHEQHYSYLQSVLEPLANKNGFLFQLIDLRSVKGRFDDILFVFKRL
jgi:hypothetical protein